MMTRHPAVYLLAGSGLGAVLASFFHQIGFYDQINLANTDNAILEVLGAPHQGRAASKIDTTPIREVVATTTTESSYVSPYQRYIPAPSEEYVLTNARKLGFAVQKPFPSGCDIWFNQTTKTPYYNELQAFLKEMEEYSKLLDLFPGVETDLRVLLKENPTQREEICTRLDLHPDGVLAMFASKQLSYTAAGYVEPLLPPMRHPGICKNKGRYLLKMEYMVHDFAEMCKSLRPDTRTVFIDMGASLDFHAGQQSPAMYITKLYAKFGFVFDHIYAFEVSEKKPSAVYEKVPENFMASYHWINVGVSPDPNHKYNPLSSILKRFNHDDFVVVKLDVDTPWIEIALAYQILRDSNLTGMIDQFYFEHHVHLKELAPNWVRTMNGTIQETLQLFHDMREQGVAAHFWP